MDMGEMQSKISTEQGVLGASVINGLADAVGATKAAAKAGLMSEDRELYMLAMLFCDAAISLGKQDKARKAIAELIADQGVTHGAS